MSKKNLFNNSFGFAHLLVVIAVFAVLTLGAGAYYLATKDSDNDDISKAKKVELSEKSEDSIF